MSIIGLHGTAEGIVRSTGGGASSDVLEWLVEHRKHHLIAYDLDYFVAAVARLSGMTEEEGLRLADTHRVLLRGTGYKFGYWPGKVFTLDYGGGKGHPFITVYDARQYSDAHYTGHDDPLAQAVEAEAVGKDLVRAMRKLGIWADSLTSPIHAFGKSGLMPPLLTWEDMPDGAGEFAYRSLKPNWVESYKLGHWPHSYDYDINAAYGSELVRLLDLRRGFWEHCPGGIPARAHYGFGYGQLTISAPLHPYLVSDGTSNYSPTGTWSAFLTLREIQFLEEFGLGEFSLEEGWWWTPDEGQLYEPLRGVVTRLWNQRDRSDPMLDKVAKRVIAGIWGRMLQVRNRGTKDEVFGDRFNPVYGAIVESNVRLRVARACLENGVTPISVAVDGIVSEKALNVPLGTEMGAWRVSHEGRCLVVGSGIVGMEGKPTTEEFSIGYERLCGMLQEAPGAESYTMRKLAPVTISKALNEHAWPNVGLLETMERTINVGDETKRLYPKSPRTGADLLAGTYESMPLDSMMALHHSEDGLERMFGGKEEDR